MFPNGWVFPPSIFQFCPVFLNMYIGNGASTQIGSPVPNLLHLPSTQPTSLALKDTVTTRDMVIPHLVSFVRFPSHWYNNVQFCKHIPCCLSLFILSISFPLVNFTLSQRTNNQLLWNRSRILFIPPKQHCFHSYCKHSQSSICSLDWFHNRAHDRGLVLGGAYWP